MAKSPGGLKTCSKRIALLYLRSSLQAAGDASQRPDPVALAGHRQRRAWPNHLSTDAMPGGWQIPDGTRFSQHPPRMLATQLRPQLRRPVACEYADRVGARTGGGMRCCVGGEEGLVGLQRVMPTFAANDGFSCSAKCYSTPCGSDRPGAAVQ